MSYVADILLLTSIEESGVAEVQAWLKANSWPALVEISGHAGGNKMMRADVWAAAINYFDVSAFVAFVKEVKWEYADAVQLLIKNEDDDYFILTAMTTS